MIKTYTTFIAFAILALLHHYGAAQPTGKLVIATDAACSITVDGKPQGTLANGGVKTIVLSAGTHTLGATASINAKARWGPKPITIYEGRQSTVTIQLADIIAVTPKKPGKKKPEPEKKPDQEIVLQKTPEVQNQIPKETKPSVPDGMVLVEGESFSMGSNDGNDNEKPVHPVYVSSFYMDKYEVTVAQWRLGRTKSPRGRPMARILGVRRKLK